MKVPVYVVPDRSCKAKGRAKARLVAWATLDRNTSGRRIARYFWTLNADGYACTRVMGHTVFMHHMVLGKRCGHDVAHRNANKLDNRSINLEHASRSANMLNTADPLRSNNTSGYRGVTRDDRNRRLRWPWRGKVMVRGRSYQTARHATARQAAMALNALRSLLGVPRAPRVQEFPEGLR